MKRKQMYMSLFVVAILVLSTFAFVLSFNQNQQQDLSYNGFEFTLQNNQWATEIQTPFGEKEYSFFNHPNELLIDVPAEISAKVKASQTITLSFDPSIQEIQYIDAARFQLTQYLIQDLGKNVRNAVTNQTTAYDFPLETCGTAQDSLYVTFTQGNQSSASITNNCITISSFTSLDHLKYSEKIIYQLLGVM